MLLVLKKGLPKNFFSTLWYVTKNFVYYIMHATALERFHIVTHSYVASFSIKTRFYEMNNIIYFKN